MKTENNKAAPAAPDRDTLTITLAELKTMTAAQQPAFRDAGGTVVENHALTIANRDVVK